MNEQIKLLALQAGIVIPKDSEYNGHIYRNAIEKFAHLLVKECDKSDTLERMREMVKVQGESGNWNYDPYMLGMYNGMEFMLSMLEDREPIYRTRPDVWLCDLPKDKVIGNPVGEE